MNPSLYRIIVYIITFLMGGIGIAYEYTLSKVASDLLGNTMMQWAIIIGVMMLCMGIGSDIQKHIPDKDILSRFIWYEILLGILGGFGPVFLIWIFGVSRDHFALVHYTLSVLIGLLIGIEIPVLARINEKYTPLLRINLGGILRMDYIGAFVGALAWIFVLTRIYSLTETAFFLGFLNISVAMLAYLFLLKDKGKAVIAGIGIILSLTSVSVGGILAPKWTRYAEQHLFRDKIIFTATTQYQHIVMTRKTDGTIFCYINGNLQFSSIDEHWYHEHLVHTAMHVAPVRRNVLVLGGGDGLAVREILKYSDVSQVTVVDIDPVMTDLATNNQYLRALNGGAFSDSRVRSISNRAITPGKPIPVMIRDRRYFNAAQVDTAARVHIFNMDAAQYVAQAPGVYDVIIIDFPDPAHIDVAKLYSKSFYTNIRAKLARDGIFVQQSSSPVYAKEAFLCIGRTMRAADLTVAPFHDNIPTFGEWGWWIGGASPAIQKLPLNSRVEALDTLRVTTEYLSPAVIKSSFVFGKGQLETADTCINTLLNNNLFTLYNRGIAAFD